MREFTHETAQGMIFEIDKNIKEIQETILKFKTTIADLESLRRTVAQYIE